MQRHNFIADGGLTIDLSQLTDVKVNTAAKEAIVQGELQADLLAALTMLPNVWLDGDSTFARQLSLRSMHVSACLLA